MTIDQQQDIFTHVMAVAKISQTIMGGTSHSMSDPAQGIAFNGRQYNLDDAIRLLNIQIAHAQLEHERNGRAIEDALSYLNKLSDELQIEQNSRLEKCHSKETSC